MPDGPRLGAHALGEHLQPALGGGVYGRTRAGGLALHRADVDNLAPAARPHAAAHLPSDPERRAKVRVDEAVPFVIGEVEDRRAVLNARVVDEDVDRADRVLDA